MLGEAGIEEGEDRGGDTRLGERTGGSWVQSEEKEAGVCVRMGRGGRGKGETWGPTQAWSIQRSEPTKGDETGQREGEAGSRGKGRK